MEDVQNGNNDFFYNFLNPNVELKIIDERLRSWGLPKYGTDGSAAIDLYACIEKPIVLYPGSQNLIGSGIAIHLDNENYAMVVVPRSGLGAKRGIVLGNLVGLIDSDYQGEIKMMMWNRSDSGLDSRPFTVNPGDRICQAMVVPVVHPNFKIVNDFGSSTLRGEGGFGHTGVSKNGK